MNKNVHYKPKHHVSGKIKSQTRKSILRAFKKKIRQLLKKNISEDMEE